MVSKVCLSRTETDTIFIFVYIILFSFIKKPNLHRFSFNWVRAIKTESKLSIMVLNCFIWDISWFSSANSSNIKTKSMQYLFANISMIEMVSLPPLFYSLYNWHIQFLWFIKNKVLLFRSTKELRMWIEDSVVSCWWLQDKHNGANNFWRTILIFHWFYESSSCSIFQITHTHSTIKYILVYRP